MQTFSSAIPIEEWDRARRLYDIARTGELSGIGQVRLTSDGTLRRWYATDSVRAACFDGGPERNVYDISVPPALLRFSLGESEAAEELELVIDSEHRTITLRGPASSVTVEDLHYTFPSVGTIRPDDVEVGGRAEMCARDLHNVVGTAWRSRAVDVEQDQPVTFMLKIAKGVLECRVVNRRACDASATVTCEATGDVAVEINGEYLSSVIELFRPHDEIVVEIPRYSNLPVVIHSDDRWGVVMPVEHPAAVLERSVEQIIEEVLGPLAVRRDADGDYPLVRRTMPVYARLLPQREPATLQVFAVVVDGIETSAELMTELNDLNVNGSFVRVFHVEDQVLAEVDLVAETLDPVVLNAALEQVWDLGQRIMPMLSAVFGGDVVTDPAAQRLAIYRDRVVEAEVNPGHLTQLNGEDSVVEWPFPGTVHVLTGWDPQGVAFDPADNELVNRRIATAVVEAGGRFVHGLGRSPSGDHSEPSLVVWGLSPDDVITFARRASQEAILEVDADTVRLVSCVGDEGEEWPRRS
jgi:hypothetical protein